MKHTLRLLAKIVLLPLCVSISSAAYAQTDVMNSLLQRLAAGIQKTGDVLRRRFQEILQHRHARATAASCYCMQAHEDKISDGCASVLDEVVFQVEATADNLREAVNACRGDIDKFCATTLPGQGRLAACLAANRTSVSKSCVEAVQKLQEK